MPPGTQCLGLRRRVPSSEAIAPSSAAIGVDCSRILPTRSPTTCPARSHRRPAARCARLGGEMPFFIADQKQALDRLHQNDPQHAPLVEFLQTTLERFAADRLAPQAARRDAVEEFDVDAFRALGQTGYLGLPYGEDVGGLGGAFTYAIAGLESLAKADAGFALGVAIHGTTTDGIYRFAGPELRQR